MSATPCPVVGKCLKPCPTELTCKRVADTKRPPEK